MTVMKKLHAPTSISPSQKWLFGFSWHKYSKIVNIAKTKFSQNHNTRAIKEEKIVLQHLNVNLSTK